MPRFAPVLLALATLSAPCLAQSADPAGPSSPAPIERNYTPNRSVAARVQSSQPIPGIYVRVSPNGRVSTVSTGSATLELRVDRGVANVDVHHPASNPEILVDLPGGQTDLIKDGLYTFNAGTNTVRVLKGEAYAYPGPVSSSKGSEANRVKVKEDHAVTFSGPQARAVDFNPVEARADLLPADAGSRGYGATGYPGRYYPAYGYPGYAFGPYGDGFYPAPYYAYGAPYLWDSPYWGYGYPFGFGIGFGYYGGFGGFRGFRR